MWSAVGMRAVFDYAETPDKRIGRCSEYGETTAEGCERVVREGSRTGGVRTNGRWGCPLGVAVAGFFGA